MKKWYNISILCLVLVLLVSTVLNFLIHSQYQIMKKDIEARQDATVFLFTNEIINMYNWTKDWQDENYKDWLDNNNTNVNSSYAYYMSRINNQLSNALTILGIGSYSGDQQVKRDLEKFFGQYERLTSMYEGIFISSQGEDLDEKYRQEAEVIFADLHLISTWVMNRNEIEDLFTVQDLREDGIYRMLETPSIKSIMDVY